MHKLIQIVSSKENQLNKVLLPSLLSIAAFGIIENIQYSFAQSKNTATQDNTTSNLDDPKTPLEFIEKIRGLLVQTITEYNNGNYTGAEELATTACLDNYEYVEAPLAEKDRPLMETTEIMMREELRQMILDKVPIEDLQEHITKINENLDKSVEILSESN